MIRFKGFRIKPFPDGWAVVDEYGRRRSEVVPYHIQAQQDMLRLMMEEKNAKQKQEAGKDHEGGVQKPKLPEEGGNPEEGGM